jgi:transposase
LHALRLDADRLPTPRADGDREALRILLGARRELTTTKTRTINSAAGAAAHRQRRRPSALPRRADTRPATRRSAAPKPAVSPSPSADSTETSPTTSGNSPTWSRTSFRSCWPSAASARSVPPRPSCPGLTRGGPGRCRNDAAYAALAGASPIPASSGRIIRHRLNRGGDRHLNRALHDTLLTRWRTCPRTHAYIARRRVEGKTDPEIRRCLKRYIARELYRCLNTAAAA